MKKSFELTQADLRAAIRLYINNQGPRVVIPDENISFYISVTFKPGAPVIDIASITDQKITVIATTQD